MSYNFFLSDVFFIFYEGEGDRFGSDLDNMIMNGTLPNVTELRGEGENCTMSCEKDSVRESEDPTAPEVTIMIRLDNIPDLDGKTGLLTGLLAGKQGWKCPVDLLMT